jgi:hypothetical protein
MNCARCGSPLAPDSPACLRCGAPAALPPLPEAGERLERSAPAPAAARTLPLRSAWSATVDRAFRIVLHPRAAWPALADEPLAAKAIWRDYVAPLAAIGALAMLVGQVLVGSPVPLLGLVRAQWIEGISAAAVLLALTLASVALLAWLVDVLAPRFGGERDAVRALKLVAYSATPGWLAGVLQIVPALSPVAVFAQLYGLYLLYAGLPVLMRCPRGQSAAYAAAAIVGAALSFMLVGVLTTCVAGFGPAMFA